MGRALSWFRAGLASLAIACATVPSNPSILSEAQTRYASLEAQHAEQRIEGDMIRARASLDTARAAVSQGEDPTLVAGLSTIALRMVQIAEARFARAVALQATDSLQKLRLARELAASRAREALLEAQRATLEREAAQANARADSLRRAAAAAALGSGLVDTAGLGSIPNAVPGGTGDSATRSQPVSSADTTARHP
jgi:hypothetical protein